MGWALRCVTNPVQVNRQLGVPVSDTGTPTAHCGCGRVCAGVKQASTWASMRVCENMSVNSM